MQKKIKILVNGITLEEGNIVPLLLKIKKWQKDGHKIFIVGNQTLKERIKKMRILQKTPSFLNLKKTKKIKDKFFLIFEGLRRNLELFKSAKKYEDFDVVYSISSVLDLVIFPFFLKVKNKKIKWGTVFDNIVPLTDPGNKLVRFLAWLFFQISLLLLRKADCIFVISEELKNYLIKKGFDKNKIVLTGNAVEVDLIKKAKPSSRYKIDALFVGRINETKGIYDILDVLEIVKEKYPNFQLAIMGRGDINTERKYKEEIKKRRLEKNVKFLGFKTGLEKFNIIKSSKVFLFLSKSKSESFGIALLEAVCCGLKAFAYDLPAYRNIYKNNEVLIFKKNDFRSAAKAILETFDKQDFGNPAGVKLLNKYSWDKIAEIELNSFRKLVG
jgi:glycosyltransferase involved in cell wall biosynthesis